MAVDANVIIFERIREELRNGRSVRNALEAGYKRAFRTIFDSNITTFGTALILYNIGTGPIRGFGLTLMLGIVASMFTALFVTRLIFEFNLERLSAKSLSIGKGFKGLINPKWTLITKNKLFYAFSTLLIVGSIGTTIVYKGGFNWGIDFVGGKVYEMQFKQSPNTAELKTKLNDASTTIRSIGALEEKKVLVSTDVRNTINAEKLQKQLGGKVLSEELVGPRIGKSLQLNAIKSFGLALFLIIIYIWIRFGKFGLGFGIAAVIALFHDLLVTWGLFGVLGQEISLTFVAACLTIIGYSLNDTIVVFDRIRENTELNKKDKFIVRVNTAINQSISRTLITSITTLFVVIILALFGGEGTQSFAIAMIIGVIVGTYSSIAIASTFVVWWSQRSQQVK